MLSEARLNEALIDTVYTAPNSAVQALTQICISGPPTFFHWFRDKKQPLAATWSAIGIAGCAILLSVPAGPSTQSTRLAGVILTSTTAGNYTVIMSVIGCNFTGFTKKQVATSITFALYCIVSSWYSFACASRHSEFPADGLTRCADKHHHSPNFLGN